ncbi:nitroreductase [candidate division LCP-89 bacterium B3_LCP]|uniref:Nitroreductase n=1 Tax=candidate division LCP-89 bacterium B3_LCP TaxID=2012998 RepID=A0A532V6H4_UNCL8|nr:MAG: nitroreductase [candidate division LCP-89 bacterium B3_LCP]
MISFFKKLKLKLQFTGWLQYLLPLVIVIIFLIAVSIIWMFELMIFANLFLGTSSLLFAITLFDILTVKYDIRPREKLSKRYEGMDEFDLMRARRSCRSFQSRLLTSSDREELLETSQKFHASESDKIGAHAIRFEYINARLTVWPVVGAQEFLVAIVPKAYSRKSVIDVGRNLQKIVHHATRMGLASCWIGPGADQESIALQLGDRFKASEDHIICVCAFGYKSWFTPITLRIASFIQHKRLPISSLFFTDPLLKEPISELVYPFNLFGRCYEVCQWAPSSFNAQPTRCVAVMETDEENEKEHNLPATINESGLLRFDFYATTSSRYYAPVALGIWCANWEIGCEALGVNGHFELLSEKQRNISKMPINRETSKYDVSWVLDK